MGAYGELFGRNKLRSDGTPTGPEQEHDPEGPVDLERGVVYLAPRENSPGSTRETRGQPE
jgi:hypothetical protein